LGAGVVASRRPVLRHPEAAGGHGTARVALRGVKSLTDRSPISGGRKLTQGNLESSRKSFGFKALRVLIGGLRPPVDFSRDAAS